jgi:hypothetical protein
MITSESYRRCELCKFPVADCDFINISTEEQPCWGLVLGDRGLSDELEHTCEGHRYYYSFNQHYQKEAKDEKL